MLEIASGYGRWTHFLRNYATKLIAIDLAENCIEACKQRFAGDPRLSLYANDGKSLAMVEDNSLDFVFSYDSLVHADPEVLEAYLFELKGKMKENSVGFIHHSNFGEFRKEYAYVMSIPVEIRPLILNKKYAGPHHWRSQIMTAPLFREMCEKTGFQCISQELVNWGTEGLLIDSFSVFTPKDSKWSREPRIIENPWFMKEAENIRNLAGLYTANSFDQKQEC